jgi:hypothetical protein
MSNIENINVNKAESTTKCSSSTAALSYTGKVKISFCQGSKIIKSKTYSNNGCGPLFKFIAQCIQGEYKQAEKIRPNKVKLFFNTSDEVKLDWDKTKSATSFVTSNAPADIAVIKDDLSNIIGYKTILHFLVPAVFVNMETASNMNKSFEINQICLYSTKELVDKNCSAYFLFTSEDGKS